MLPKGVLLMTTRPQRLRSARQLVRPLLALCMDSVRCVSLCLHPSPALAAEHRLLRKQLALYQERHVTQRRATQATCIALVWLSQWCDGRPASAVGQPKPFIRWHCQALRLLWRWPSRPGCPPIPPELQALLRPIGP